MPTTYRAVVLRLVVYRYLILLETHSLRPCLGVLVVSPTHPNIAAVEPPLCCLVWLINTTNDRDSKNSALYSVRYTGLLIKST
jgi:hypothetical protein